MQLSAGPLGELEVALATDPQIRLQQRALISTIITMAKAEEDRNGRESAGRTTVEMATCLDNSAPDERMFN